MKIGSWVKIKVACRYGWVKGWRKVRKIHPTGDIEVCAAGYDDFIVHPKEIIEKRKEQDHGRSSGKTRT